MLIYPRPTVETQFDLKDFLKIISWRFILSCFQLILVSFSEQMVDFSSLQISTLRRYRRHFKLQNKAGMNKSQLLEVKIVVLQARSKKESPNDIENFLNIYL